MGRICRIEAKCGRVASCPDGCLFWEPGGAVLDGRCAFEHLDLDGRPEVAPELLRIKELLGEIRAHESRHEVWRRFHHLLNEED